jgi:hypothetical protein
MKTNNYFGELDDKDILESLFKEDYYTAKNSLDNIETRIAERKRLEYRNINDLEHQRQKLEQTLNIFYNLGYSQNSLSMRSKLETEMVRLEIKKGEEGITAFRDVQELETEKRKILEELAQDKSFCRGLK